MPTDFTATKAMFDLPKGVVYLDGNSLGPLVKGVNERVARTLNDEWGQMLIAGWNRAGWMDMPARLGDRIGGLIGAPAGSVMLGDTLSIKVYQALAAALAMVPERHVILSDTGNFPSDLYIAEGLCAMLGNGTRLVTVAPEEVEAALGESVGVLLLTEVDYRTGRRHDMARLSAAARANGTVTVWDLAHSAGATDVDLSACGVDFAVGCTYKYLNAGPGGPAFIHVSPDHAESVRPALAGWLGHAAPFAFETGYRPAQGIERMRVGTPPVLQLAALDTALDVWDSVAIADLRQRSLALTDAFIAGVEATSAELVLATPRAHAERGSQVGFRHPEGYAIIQALIAEGVIGDFRAPDILRFGFAPLFIDFDDVAAAVSTIARVMKDRLWDTARFRTRARVT